MVETERRATLEARALSDPVGVTLALAQPPQLGHLDRLHARVSSTWDDLLDVTVRLEVPDGLLAGERPLVLGEMRLGEERSLAFPVLPAAAGIWRLSLSISGRSAAYGPVGGYASLFLEVPPEGPGEASERPLVRSAEGPAVQRDSRGWEATRQDPKVHPHPATEFGLGPRGHPAAAASVGPSSHASFNVTGQWTYFLEDLISTAPQRWATVEVWDEDAGDDDLLWSGLTDGTGAFTSADLPRAEEPGEGNQDVYLRFVACNSAVCAQATNGTTYSWRTETVPVGGEDTLSFGTRAPGTNRFAPRPFQYINDAWDYAVNLGGLGSVLGQVRVLMPDACTFYTLGDDTIHLCAGGIDDRSPDDVSHEYAHYVQDKLYGDAFWPSPGGIHFACGDGQNRSLAWTEGFADFFGPRANQAIVDPQDRFYRRPWDGSLFSFDMEDELVCPPEVQGDDNELRVATALWDLADDVDDGPWDLGIGHPPDVLLGAIAGCDQSTFRDYYDGGRCNWVDRGNPRFDLIATAFQNTIDYNLDPVAQVTSPSVFFWAEGLVLGTATATDPDGNVTRVEFRVSVNDMCSSFELLGVVDTFPPFSANVDSRALPERPTYWMCARAFDELEPGAWAPSPQSFGVDRTPPATNATVAGVLGPAGWFVAPVTVSLDATDPTSGVSSISYRVDDGEVRTYTEPFEIRGDGIHTVAFFAVDAAGNVEDVQPLVVLIDTG
ncbi:MAG: hypothetical protein R3291_00755, partial [Thermoplasmata archaeon]|nr:hypothetical protein [Thermoplasmata archaeon]